MRNYSIFILATLLILSCKSKKESKEAFGLSHSITTIKYAEGFTVTNLKDAKLVEVIQPYQGAKVNYRYLIVQKGKPLPHYDGHAKVIVTPIKTIVCTSTTHIPLLDYLNESESLIGFPTTNNISSEKTRAHIDSGRVVELGIDKGMDLERLAVLKPDLVMGYTMTGDLGQFNKIEELGIPVTINAEYLERNPLGRAEWIKFMALFYNKEAMADSIFNAIEKAYLETKALAKTIKQRPTVMTGVVYGDAWFLPGGKNYAAQLLRDAGCQYLWEDDPSNGFLELSFESVYEKANQADLWIGVASFNSLEEIKIADHRYTKFKPFKTGNIFSYNARKGVTGGSEFLELGYLRPDIILKDLVKITSPNLLPDHGLFFYKRLK